MAKTNCSKANIKMTKKV